MSNLLNTVANNIDEYNSPTYNYFTLVRDPNTFINPSQFAKMVASDLNESEAIAVCGALDLYRNGMVKFYHFLAVIESYRKKFIGPQPLKIYAPKVKKVVTQK